MQDWKDILRGQSSGFYVRLPREYGSREIFKAWDEENNVLEFPIVVDEVVTDQGLCQNQLEYQSLVQRAIQTIGSGQCEKLVTSRIFKLESNDFAIETLVEKWISVFLDAFVFVLQHPEYGLWIGASPELLLYRNGRSLHSVALAGSKAKDDLSEWGDKEREEHEVVARMIKDTFIAKGVSEVVASETKVLNFRNVKHLCTNISGYYSGDFGGLVKSLYPTPALSGWPKWQAIEWLCKNEPFQRGLYGGVLNFSEGPEQWSMVILRCCHKTSNGWLGHVGGGVMLDSEPELEWQETEWKRQAFIFANDAHFQ